MATKRVKLIDLKVVDLKRELEERDEDTKGTKPVLQERLRALLLRDNEDPENYLFEIQCGMEDICKMLQDNSKMIQDNSRMMQATSKSVDEKFEKQQDNFNALQGKLQDNSEMLYHLQDKFLACSRTWEEKFSNLEEDNKNLEKKLVNLEETLEGKLEEKLEQKILENVAILEGKIKSAEIASSQRDKVHDAVLPKQESEMNVVPRGRSHADLPTYDGKTSLEDYLTLFETAAMVNGWTNTMKAATLSLSLRGDALRVLQGLPLAERQNYSELVSRLEMRFGQKHLEQVYRSQLKSRCQRPNESLQEFEAGVAQLVRNAYPTVSDDVCESLAIDKFLDGLRDSEAQQMLKLNRPRTLNEALTQALEFEAVKQSIRGTAKVRALEEESEQPLRWSIDEIIEKVLEKMKTKRPERRCWNCGDLGHLRNKCPKPQQTSRQTRQSEN